eukprot:3296259-Rhodomonas_salina.1
MHHHGLPAQPAQLWHHPLRFLRLGHPVVRGWLNTCTIYMLYFRYCRLFWGPTSGRAAVCAAGGLWWARAG